MFAPRKNIMFLIIVSSFTACWYYSSSKCAISTQRLVQEYRKLGVDSSSMSPLSIMVVLTALQLVAGLAISYPLYLALAYSDPNFSRKKKFISANAWSYSGVAVGSLHFFGCLCTNMGFAFGSAAVVQVIKLLEPIETLLLTSLFNVVILKTSALTNITATKALSVLIIVFGTSMLLVQKGIGKHVNVHSVLYALCSGFAMASRNVVKKTAAGAAAAAAAKSIQGNEHTKKEEVAVDQEQGKRTSPDPQRVAKDGAASINDVSWRQAAMNGIVNFATITAVGTIPASICLVLAEMSHLRHRTSSSIPEGSIVQWMVLSVGRRGAEAILCHGMFNIASVSVLSLITAQSHSLLNVGKRICNVLYAALVFREPIGRNGTIGLCVAAIGGVLYSAGSAIHCGDVAVALRSVAMAQLGGNCFWSGRIRMHALIVVFLVVVLWRFFALHHDLSQSIGVTAKDDAVMASPPSTNVGSVI